MMFDPSRKDEGRPREKTRMDEILAAVAQKAPSRPRRFFCTIAAMMSAKVSRRARQNSGSASCDTCISPSSSGVTASTGEREQQEEAVAGLGPEAQEEQHRHAGTETLSGFRIESHRFTLGAIPAGYPGDPRWLRQARAPTRRSLKRKRPRERSARRRAISGASSTAPRASGWRCMTVLKEPLLHFLLAGAALFGAYAWINRAAEKPNASARRRKFAFACGRCPVACRELDHTMATPADAG